MAQEKITQEFIAPSVEEAVEQGARQLGLSVEMLDVEILDPGSRGLFGLGSRQARVRLSIKSQVATQNDPKVVLENQPKSVENSKAEKPKEKSENVQSDQNDPTLKLAQDVVSELLKKMQIEAKVEAKYLPPADEKDRDLVTVEIQGRDLSILIGRRSETLNALQYISSLIVAKESGEWVPLVIDVQGYRERRERQLRVLARRMAEQVIHTGRKQNLEPMPANERRVIHLELRDHEFVTTESVGEEPNRKVTIILKK
ncbi:MAG: RNA-binding cell elongation regulator Jag/EloR [Anaerolineaceae bacterium]